jgi:hypothetical protein
MDKKIEVNWKSYSKTLPLSKEIYLEVFGEPKTHAEWADSFNKIGRINRLIIKRILAITIVKTRRRIDLSSR